MAKHAPTEPTSTHMPTSPPKRGAGLSNAGDAALLFARTLCDDQAFLPIILGALLSAVPRSLDDWWLRRNGLAYAIATECGYGVGVGANTHSDLMTSNSVPQIEAFCFAQTNSNLNFDSENLE